MTDVIRGSMSTDDGSSSATAVVGAALRQFTNLISEALKSWQDHQSYSNADPAIRKKDDEFLLMKQIQEMEEAATAKDTLQGARNGFINPLHGPTPCVDNAVGIYKNGITKESSTSPDRESMYDCFVKANTREPSDCLDSGMSDNNSNNNHMDISPDSEKVTVHVHSAGMLPATQLGGRHCHL